MSAKVASLRQQLAEGESLRDAARRAASKADNVVTGLETTIAAMRRNIARLHGIDCWADGSGRVNSTCQFISSAVADRDLLPSMLEDLAISTKALAEAAKATDRCDSDVVALKSAIAAADQEIETLSKFTRLVGELNAAESNLAIWRTDLASVASEREHAAATICPQLDALKMAENEEADAHTVRIVAFNSELTAIPAIDDINSELVSARACAAAADSACTVLRSNIRNLEDEMIALRVKLENVVVKREAIALADAEIKRYNSAIADFMVLGKACGNAGGIISLEIDDAGPSISAIANDLLASCYGSRFSVRMDTQAEKADGGVKEVFDFMVFDSDTDSERSITELSGGQSSWVNDAITRAICLFNIGRSGKVYDTLFADEIDGALDTQKKQEFFAVKRKALELGSHCREFFISQTPELVEMADAQIVLEPGRVYVQ